MAKWFREMGVEVLRILAREGPKQFAGKRPHRDEEWPKEPLQEGWDATEQDFI